MRERSRGRPTIPNGTGATAAPARKPLTVQRIIANKSPPSPVNASDWRGPATTTPPCQHTAATGNFSVVYLGSGRCEAPALIHAFRVRVILGKTYQTRPPESGGPLLASKKEHGKALLPLAPQEVRLKYCYSPNLVE